MYAFMRNNVRGGSLAGRSVSPIIHAIQLEQDTT